MQLARKNRFNHYQVSSQLGVTLIELIITMTLITIIAGVISFVIASAFQSVEHSQRRKVIVIDGTHASEMFRRDVSLMKDSESLLVAESKRVRFKTPTDQTIEYQISNGYLYRTIVGQYAPHILAKNVNDANSVFQYFNNEMTGLTSVPLSLEERGQVWVINMTLVMVHHAETIPFSATVFPKNLHVNHNVEI